MIDYALRDALYTSDDAHVRAAAAKSIDDATLAPALIDALYDTHPSVRLEAAQRLGRLQVKAALGLLRRLALEEPIWWVRRAAVLAVARMERDTAFLLTILDDPFWRVRHAAARALLALRLEVPEAEAMLKVAREEQSERAVGAMHYLLHRLGHRDASLRTEVEAVPTGKLFDPDPAVITARLEHGQKATTAELALYIGDPHEALRKEAAERLSRSNDVRALLAASLWLEEPRIPFATASVVALLDRLQHPEPLIEYALAHCDERPGLAVWVLSLPREMDVSSALTAKSAHVRRAAVARVDDVEALERVLATEHDEDVRRQAAFVLSQVHPRSLLSLDFEKESVLVRRLIAHAAAEEGRVVVLRRALHERDPEIRATALRALDRAGVLEAEVKSAARTDGDPWIRSAVLSADNALQVLANDPPLAREAFQAAADKTVAARVAMASDDVWLRTHAAERLARSREDEDLVRVLQLSRDADPGVRAAAADVLSISKRDIHERLLRVRENPVVRDAADTWLGTRATALMQAPREEQPRSELRPRKERAEPKIVSRRMLGRTGIEISPLVLSGAHEPPIPSLFQSWMEGVNAFFWEPRYKNLSTFLKGTRQAVVIAGTYHASEKAIRKDVERALGRLNRDQLDVFLVFWTRSQARLDGEVPRVLAKLKQEGLVRSIGFSTHDRELATKNVPDWDVVMVRHSAAHPGAEGEDSVFQRAAECQTGVLGFSATSYSRLLAKTVPAADCYRYSLSQRGVTACLSAPRNGHELAANLAVLNAPTLDPDRLAELRAHGQIVRQDSVSFAEHIRRFPALPEDPEKVFEPIADEHVLP